jgi:hypothetical protein
MFAGWKKWRAKVRQDRSFAGLKREAVIALKAGGGFAAPVNLIGPPDQIQRLIEILTTEVGHHVRASVSNGLCFVYPDGTESAPSEFTMLGIKR